jgi:RecA-family ATPase
MDLQNKYDQFFEQIKNKPLTATAIMNAIKANGYAPELKPFYLSIARANDADIKAELDAVTQAQETARQEKAIQEATASLAEKSGALVKETDPKKRKELIEDIQRVCETLEKTEITEPKIITSKALMQKEFPPRQWIVENLIGPGLSIFSGASKIGKSWLLYALAEAASTGGKLLNHYTVKKTSVLHLSLEDKEQNIKERREILAMKQKSSFDGNDDLFITTEWKSGPDGLEVYLRSHNKIKFVLIDTLGKFMPEIENMNDYTPAVKALSRIKRIADSLDIAILIAHHAKKGNGKGTEVGDWMDQSLGSQGIVASADTIIILQRDIENKTGERKNTGKLYATGRSIKDTFHKVEFSPDFGMWSIIDKKSESRGETEPLQLTHDREGWSE